MIEIVIFLSVVIVLLLSHELAHFSVARLFRIKVNSIQIGFRIPYLPKACINTKCLGINIAICPLPLGASVGMSYTALEELSLGKRIAVLGAGSAANIMTGFISMLLIGILKGFGIIKSLAMSLNSTIPMLKTFVLIPVDPGKLIDPVLSVLL